MISQNTHDYDNQLGNTKKVLAKLLAEAANVPQNIKMENILKLKEAFVPVSTPQGLNFFNLLVQRPAYDPINQLHPIDLLYICSVIFMRDTVDKKDFLCNLNIQFEDMATGFCAQGQTIRLLQIIYSFNI
ncbi:MAG TPA: hypothetical protein PKD85_00430 [Saprospiraceae bacterium]|nr:hypothetical protein [Saprospiraceae bacterium]